MRYYSLDLGAFKNLSNQLTIFSIITKHSNLVSKLTMMINLVLKTIKNIIYFNF